jgi:hypothetical protein
MGTLPTLQLFVLAKQTQILSVEKKKVCHFVGASLNRQPYGNQGNNYCVTGSHFLSSHSKQFATQNLATQQQL